MPQIGLLVSLAERRDWTRASPPADRLTVRNSTDSVASLTSALLAFWHEQLWRDNGEAMSPPRRVCRVGGKRPKAPHRDQQEHAASS
jgi:hypothetical protein